MGSADSELVHHPHQITVSRILTTTTVLVGFVDVYTETHEYRFDEQLLDEETFWKRYFIYRTFCKQEYDLDHSLIDLQILVIFHTRFFVVYY